MSYSAPHTPGEIVALAGRHGLIIGLDSVRINEAGLDYRVAYATGRDGESWVLRIPRRAGMTDSIAAESRILELVQAHLDVAVPQWQIAEKDFIAYPLLPGSPALTLNDGEPVFHVDVASIDYARDLGTLLAALHTIPIEVAQHAGITNKTITQVRAERRADLTRVAENFTIRADLMQRWAAWLDTDSYWPAHTVMTHGEPYQAHVLVNDHDRITGILDWTTAGIDDPARDLATQHLTAPPEVFETTLRSYQKGGGQVWPRLADHCAEIIAFGPVLYGLFALTSGETAHLDAAAAMVNPPDGD